MQPEDRGLPAEASVEQAIVLEPEIFHHGTAHLLASSEIGLLYNLPN
jgi:hypothetical protein